MRKILYLLLFIISNHIILAQSGFDQFARYSINGNHKLTIDEKNGIEPIESGDIVVYEFRSVSSVLFENITVQGGNFLGATPTNENPKIEWTASDTDKKLNISYRLGTGALISGEIIENFLTNTSDFHHTATKTYKINDTIKAISKSKSYFNSFGNVLQSNAWDYDSQKVWITETLYDKELKPVIHTLPVPVTEKKGTITDNDLSYRNDHFIDHQASILADHLKSNQGIEEIQNSMPLPRNSTDTDLGGYYGNKNKDLEKDITDYPYTRNIYGKLNPDQILKTVGGNKQDGEWKSGFSYTMSASQELYYAFGNDEFKGKINEHYITSNYPTLTITNDKKNRAHWLHANKTIVQDIHGIETIAFIDTEGKTLATAKSGGAIQYEVLSLIGEQGFVDIHIPEGCDDTLQFTIASSNFKVWDLRTDKEIVAANNSLKAGFYRIELNKEAPNYTTIVNQQGNVTWNDQGKLKSIYESSSASKSIYPGVYYKVNYYDYSLNYYNDNGYLIQSLPPLGFDNNVLSQPDGIQDKVYQSEIIASPTLKGHDDHLLSTYVYNSLGQLIESTSPDEGRSKFIYRKDGQVRFSQNEKQLKGADGQYPFVQNSLGEYIENNLDRNDEEFSYTLYDSNGRPIKSGVAITGENLSFMRESYDLRSPDIYNYVSNWSESNDVNNILTLPEEQELPLTDEAFRVLQANAGHSKYDEELETVYDQSIDVSAVIQSQGVVLASNYGKQTFVRGNVSCTKNPEVETYYSYDIYGRVKWVVRYLKEFVNPDSTKGKGKTFTIEYTYDSVTSEVTKVAYQKHVLEEAYYHQYEYDDGGKLVQVSTSKDDTNYRHQASYIYYEDGKLKRLELAKIADTEKPIQSIDYIYNLSGQLKAINNPEDLEDTNAAMKDFFGMEVHYYQGDYLRNNWLGGHSAKTEGIPQYNGNISRITWKNNLEEALNTYYYKYNKNNYLEAASFNQNIQEGDENVPENITVQGKKQTSNQDLTARTSITLPDGFEVSASEGITFSAKIGGGKISTQADGDYNVYGITYDANGNIQSLNRNGYKASNQSDNFMDKLTYNYTDANHPNQLQQVMDDVDEKTNSYGNSLFKDIQSQASTHNYVYNSIGQLIENKEEGITYLYNAAGLVTEVHKENNPVVKFFYDDLGQRVRKERYRMYGTNKGTLANTTVYVRDASGQVMAIYSNNVGESTMNQKELPIYGASRLGIAKVKDGMINSETYELTDHLGNVRGTVMRGKNQELLSDNEYFTDYFPFGMQMPNPNSAYFDSENVYRYAYQGQEKDAETGKEAFELRLWDSRIGRWLTTDPARQFYSPYKGMGNNPINMFDPDGAFAFRPPGGCCGPNGRNGFDKIPTQQQINNGLQSLVRGYNRFVKYGPVGLFDDSVRYSVNRHEASLHGEKGFYGNGGKLLFTTAVTVLSAGLAAEGIATGQLFAGRDAIFNTVNLGINLDNFSAELLKVGYNDGSSLLSLTTGITPDALNLTKGAFSILTFGNSTWNAVNIESTTTSVSSALASMFGDGAAAGISYNDIVKILEEDKNGQ